MIHKQKKGSYVTIQETRFSFYQLLLFSLVLSNALCAFNTKLRKAFHRQSFVSRIAYTFLSNLYLTVSSWCSFINYQDWNCQSLSTFTILKTNIPFNNWVAQNFTINGIQPCKMPQLKLQWKRVYKSPRVVGVMEDARRRQTPTKTMAEERRKMGDYNYLLT